MAAAVTTVGRYTGASGSRVGAAVTTGAPCQWTRDDSNSGATAIPIPTTSAVTKFSFDAALGLRITTAGSPATTISNRRLSLASAMAPTGYQLYMRTASDASYVQGAQIADTATQIGTPPTGFQAITTTPALYDNQSLTSSVTSDASGTAAPNGNFIRAVTGIDNTAVVTGTQNLPNVVVTYDEI